jgi:cytochrome c peroxidase
MLLASIGICLALVLVVVDVFFGPTETENSTAPLENSLRKVINEYNLRPIQIRRFDADPKFRLGRALFFDPLLSGTRDVSCATCHSLQYGTSDSLPRSIGVHGVGIGPKRKLLRGEAIHPRNALDLWNRDNNALKALFWDGRVEVLDPVHRVFRSPLGGALPSGLQNALAVQALFPLVTPDEMLGNSDDRSSLSLPRGHANSPNDLAPSGARYTEVERIRAVHSRIMLRLLGSENPPNFWQKSYRNLFSAAYPGRLEQSFSIVDLANAIAHFEEMAFATRDSAWDRYLRGTKDAISVEAKDGALLFFGRARCVACHDGPLLSDFDYHSVGIFSSGLDGSGPDYGRWRVTGLSGDKYKFRTPPLRNVTKTAPYFHDGSEPTLKGALRRHLNPLDRADKYNYDGSFAMSRDQIDSISSALVPRIVLSDRELETLIAFLSSLDFEPTNLSVIVPQDVPSGLPVVAP